MKEKMSKKSNKNDFLSIFDEEKSNLKIPRKLSVLPLRDVVIYPYMIYPVLIGRNSSLRAVAEAMERNKFIFVVAQKQPNIDEPTFDDLYEYGTVAKVVQVLRLPNNLLKVLLEGEYQGFINKKYTDKEFLEANITVYQYKNIKLTNELQALINSISEKFEEYVKKDLNIPQDVTVAYNNISDIQQKLYYAAANLRCNIEKRQMILNETDIVKKYETLLKIIIEEIELKNLEIDINQKVTQTLQKSQKRFLIEEQIKALQQELGEDDEGYSEISQIKEMIEKANLPDDILTKANEELDRLKKTPIRSPEFSVNRNYIEWLVQVPWRQATQDNYDINHVKKILDDDHYNLEKAKERILEFIAVLNVVGKLKKQILCFVGPPGVGKTSLARSIARALGRKYVRFSLGGVRDEAEIRGHRRTYIGALPGKIIQSLKKAGTINPVILLDEVDKMAMDFRGDPSAALLEVLDPEQNFAFNDHYLEVDYDLSNVLFITTANVKYDIPLPLLDRMEIIELSSYIDNEKFHIAKNHIIPKLKEELGIKQFNINFSDDAIFKVIREYTRESGVRNLERELSAILRKLIKEIVEKYYSTKNINNNNNNNSEEEIKKILLIEDDKFVKNLKKKKIIIKPNDIEKFLKAPRYKQKKEKLDDKIGVVNGLAWTSLGGDLMPIEVTIMSGKDKLTLTGKLGDVMKESAIAALSYIRSNAKKFGLKEDFNKNKEIHIHVPEGAIPKDGPSAGITLATAILSAALNKKVKGNVAMTGEITLRGEILPIGGLKEKLLAAKRYGINKVLIPEENNIDLVDISEEILNGLDIIAIKNFEESIKHTFIDLII